MLEPVVKERAFAQAQIASSCIARLATLIKSLLEAQPLVFREFVLGAYLMVPELIAAARQMW